MKKLLKIIFGIVSAVLLLTISLVIYVGVSIRDNTNNSDMDIINNPEDTTVLFNSYMYDALSDTETTKRVSFLLTEKDVNRLLYSIVKDIDIPYLNIKSVYTIYNEDGTISIEGPLSYFGLSTCLKGNLDIIDENDSITIKLKDIKAGKFDTSSGLLKTFIKNIKFNKLEDDLEKEGIYLSISYNNDTVSIKATKENLVKTLDKLELDETAYILDCLIHEFIKEGSILSIKWNEDNKLGAELNLTDLENTLPLDYDLESDSPSISDVKAKMTSLISDGIVNSKNCSTVFDYLVRGYDNIDKDNQQPVIDELNLSSIGINNKKNYEGIVSRSNLTMTKIFLDVLLPTPEEQFNIITKGIFDIAVTEANLNELFNGFGFIGTSFAFIKDNEVANITISSMFCDIDDEKITVYLIVDFNGLNTVLSCEFSNGNSRLAEITLSLTSVKLGLNEMDKSAEKDLMKFLEASIKEDYLSFNSNDMTITFNFEKFLDNEFINILKNSNFKESGVLLSSSEGGKLIIRLSK